MPVVPPVIAAVLPARSRQRARGAIEWGYNCTSGQVQGIGLAVYRRCREVCSELGSGGRDLKWLNDSRLSVRQA
jgi:hypothetical protein